MNTNMRRLALRWVWLVAAILEEFFVLVGAAMVFDGGHIRWGRVVASPHGVLSDVAARLTILHDPVAAIGAVATVILVAVWGMEIKRAPARARECERQREEEGHPPRSVRLFEMLRSAVRFGFLPMLFVVATGFAVLWHHLAAAWSWLPSTANADDVVLVHLHSGHFFGPLVRALWLCSGLLLALWVLLLARVRAARLAECGERSARLYEDLPQGAALGTSMGVLFVLMLGVWSGSTPQNAALLVALVALGCTLAHASAVVAVSGGWRFLPLACALAIVLGDVFRGGGENSPLWGVAAAFGIFGLLAARVGRRYA